MTTPASEKRLIGLLSAITALLAVLVVGAVLASALAVVPAIRYAQRLESELAITRAQTQELAGLARDLRASEQRATRDLARRQGLMTRTLSVEASRSAARVAALQERRQRLERDPGPNPLAKLDLLIDLTRLLSDELLLLTHHLIATQHGLAKGVQPAPSEAP